MRKLTKQILLLISLSVFLFSAYQIYSYKVEEKRNQNLNQKLIEKAVVKSKESFEVQEETLPIQVDFSVLQQINPDIIGWLYCEDTPINYPVVQSKDNAYYLDKSVDKQENNAGSIFMDYRNQKDMTNNHTILYGHNMKNHTMFGTLENYKKQEYYDQHKTMYFFTPEKEYRIHLFAGCSISVESEIYDLEKMDMDKKRKWMKKSDFKSDIELTEEEMVITLSTCAYEYDGARYVVMGELREIGK